jgi:hypothetical protein
VVVAHPAVRPVRQARTPRAIILIGRGLSKNRAGGRTSEQRNRVLR